ETRLAALWAEVLGVERVGRHDSFFALGGHSLLALTLLERIHRQFGEDSLTLLELMREPNLSAMATTLERRPARTSIQVTVRNDHAKGWPLFILPGLQVNGSEFGAIISSQQHIRPVHCFSSHVLTPPRWAGFDIARIADEAADYIQSVVGGGRCHLLGWSIGGHLAYEVASRLHGRVDVGLIGMVDVVDNRAYPIHLSPSDESRAKLLCDAWLAQSTMSHRWRQLLARMSPQRLKLCHQAILQAEGVMPLDGEGIDAEESKLWMQMESATVLDGWQHQPAGLTLHAWQAGSTDNPFDWPADAALASRSLLPDLTHMNIIHSEPFLSALAMRLESLD
ncbi:pimeloyl-ACP methyl ester carboxylesterase, partial [Chitinivorax tropicus]